MLAGGRAQFEPGHRWTVVNYDLVSRHREALGAQEWAVLVVDEAHCIKNDSVRARRTLELLGATSKTDSGGPGAAYLLTGTPMANRPRDLFNLLKAVRHPLAKSFYTYARRYSAAYDNGYGLDTEGASNVEELARTVSGVMLRRTKSEALDLPAKVRSWVPVDVPIKRVRGIEQRALDYLKDNPARSGPTWVQFLGLLNRARHDLALVKALATADFVTDCVDAGQKMVVFTSYTGVVDVIRERFGDRCVTLTGKDSAKRRDKVVRTFQTDESVRVFVGNLLAAGVGINLTAGTHVVFNDLDWVPANHWQAEDRVHRIGQNESTFATYLHAAGTLDEPVAALLEQKAAIIATLEDAARDHASIVDAVVELALEGPAPGVHTDPTSPPRPTMGLLEQTLDLLAQSAAEELAAHEGEDTFEFESSSKPGVMYTVRLTNGVAVCDCPGFTYKGNCKHSREVIGRDR